MLNVLIVDDEAMIRRGLKKIVPWRDLGFNVIGEAENGHEALDFIRKNDVDIVLSDLRMPVMEGTELAEKIHADYNGIKVIILTGFDDFKLIQKCLREGVADYLLKPVKRELLTETLLKVRSDIETRRYPYPFRLEKELISEIDKSRINKTKELVQELFSDFNRLKMSEEAIKRILNNILVNIEKYLSAKGLDINIKMKNNIISESLFNNSESKEDVFRIFEDAVSIIMMDRIMLTGSIIPQIKNYIEANICSDLSLKKIAAEFLMNPSYLSHIFKKETGTGYIDYVISLRVEKAKTILINSRCSIDTVSTMVGYNDYRYFSRIFKKYTDMTPSEFSRKFSEEK